MNNPTLYIHIGTYKTGTSTIQKAIRNNSDLKKEKISDIGRPSSFREICIADKVEEKYIKNSQKEILGRIKRERFLGRNKFIISAEHFSGNPNNGFKNSDVVATILKKITEPLDLDVKIIVYLRRQDDFIQSLYTQEIHHGGSITFNEYISKFDKNSFNWNKLINSYADKFGEHSLIVRRYGKKYMPDHNSVVQSFGEIIGSDALKSYSKTTVSNRGYSREALEIARRINPLLNPEEKNKLRNLLQSVSSKQPFETYDYFDLEEKVEFLGRYEKSNKEVATRYFDESYLFDKPSGRTESKLYEGLNIDIMMEYLLKIIKEISVSQSAENNSGFKIKPDKLTDKIFSISPFLKENVKILFGKYY